MRRGRISRLRVEARKIDRAPVDARRGAGFEPSDRRAQFAQSRRQNAGRGAAGAPARRALAPDMNRAVQKSAGRQHDGGSEKLRAEIRADAARLVAAQQNIGDRLLDDGGGGGFEKTTRRGAIEGAVGLGAGGAHGQAAAGVQAAALDSGAIGGRPHRAAEGVDFFDEMAFADAADGGIARHLAEGVDILSEQQNARAGAVGGEGGFEPGMTAAHDKNIEPRIVAAHGRDSSKRARHGFLRRRIISKNENAFEKIGVCQ